MNLACCGGICYYIDTMVSKCIYSISNYAERLREIRLRFGYKTISSLPFNKIGISRPTWNSWETKRKKPSINCIELICNFFDINPVAFFLKDYNINKTYKLPFVLTKPAGEIFKRLDIVRKKPGLYAIVIPQESGASRAVLEYIQKYPGGLLYNADYRKNQGNYIIIDNAENLKKIGRLKNYTTKHICLIVKEEQRGSIDLSGCQIVWNLEKIIYPDIENIINTALSDMTDEIKSAVKLLFDLRLKMIYTVIKHIRELQQERPDFQLTFSYVFDYAEKI